MGLARFRSLAARHEWKDSKANNHAWLTVLVGRGYIVDQIQEATALSLSLSPIEM
jgi:hypothetical protein